MKNVSEQELWNTVLALHDKLAQNKEEILGEYLSHLRQIQDRQSMENPQILAIHQSIAKLLKADISKCNAIIKNLIIDIGEDPFAVSPLKDSYAFPGQRDSELQLFRSRRGNPSQSFSATDMLYLPIELRSISGNYRFSIPGNPSMYLSNSSYGCWIETDFPAEIDFNVSPVILDGTQKIFNLAVSNRNFVSLNEFESNRVHCWLKLYLLSVATSYRIKEPKRTFKSEYIISQSIMMACKKLKCDGIAYYSKKS